MRSIAILALFMSVAASKAIPQFSAAVLNGSEEYSNSFSIEVVELTSDPKCDDCKTTNITGVLIEPVGSTPTRVGPTHPAVVEPPSLNHTNHTGLDSVAVLGLVDINSTASIGPVNLNSTIVIGPVHLNSTIIVGSINSTIIVGPNHLNYTDLCLVPTDLNKGADFNCTITVEVPNDHNPTSFPDPNLEILPTNVTTSLGSISPFFCEFTSQPGHCCEQVSSDDIGINCFEADMFIDMDEDILFFCPPDSDNVTLFVSACCVADFFFEIVEGLSLYDCERGDIYERTSALRSIDSSYGENNEGYGYDSGNNDPLKNYGGVA